MSLYPYIYHKYFEVTKLIMFVSLSSCVHILKNQQVIAYPTESMFGFGCDPDSRKAVMTLLNLKKRSIDKGLILVASNFNQIKMYIDEQQISQEQKKTMFSYWPGPFTLLLPSSMLTPYWLTGKFNTIAVRISAHVEIVNLCNAFGKALVSTSANVSHKKPCYTYKQVFKSFGKSFPLLNGKIGNELNPSTIINIMSGNVIRYA